MVSALAAVKSNEAEGILQHHLVEKRFAAPDVILKLVGNASA
jgi:hypothetical protein